MVDGTKKNNKLSRHLIHQNLIKSVAQALKEQQKGAKNLI